MPLVSSIKMDYEQIVQTSRNDHHPAYYNVTLFHFNGMTFTEEIKKLSFEDAYKIKNELTYIDFSSQNNHEKIQKKHNLLASYDLVSSNHFGNFTRSYDYELGRGVGLFFSKVTGFFGPCSINLLSVLFAAPFFITRAHGISVHISGVFYPSFDFVSFQVINMKIFGFIGLLIVFPFLSIGGYMDGFAFMGQIQEI